MSMETVQMIQPHSKQCFKCGTTKPLSAFYTHPQMKDGHLNKCIECTKRDTVIREQTLKNDPIWRAKEMKRNRLRTRGRKIPNKPQYQAKYHTQFPEKYQAKLQAGKIKVAKGLQKHHWSYNDDHLKDVIILSAADHKKCHRFLVYDRSQRLYRRADTNELLTSKDSHQSFIHHCITNLDD